MPTYFVTNRTAKDAVSMRPLNDPISVKRASNDNEADYNLFGDLDLMALSNLKNEMPAEAIAMAGEHYPLIVVFVHGYNNNTDAALASMANIGSSLAYHTVDAAGAEVTVPVNPLMVCFDWPSNHEVWQYHL